jgi:hypothetical protein
MKPLPDNKQLDIMWRVAVTSAISGQGKPYEIFARMLYHDLHGTYDHIFSKFNYSDDNND